MKSYWIIAALLVLGLLTLLNFVGPLKGSTTSDFSEDLQPDQNPLPECPDSPNCVRISKVVDVESSDLQEALIQLLTEMNAEIVDHDSQSLQTTAVFRTPVFGFRDDVLISIEPGGTNRSVLHVSSRSRTGQSDLGVNRRRVKSILNKLN